METQLSTDKEKARLSPRDFFLNLLVMIALYASVVSFISMLFQYVNYIFPAQIDDYFRFTSVLNIIRVVSSILVVVYPLFIILSWLVNKDLIKNPQKRNLWIRKWLVYLTLFASFVTIVISLVRLVYNLYSGDLTIRFGLKVAAVLVVAIAVFGYYLWELKRKDEPTKKPKIFAIITLIVVLGSIIGGIFIVGSPAKQRNIRFDETRINNLQQIESQVYSFWTEYKKLPVNFVELEQNSPGFKLPKDPQIEKDYDYEINGEKTYRLCAEFKEETPGRGKIKTQNFYYDWGHARGKTCYDLKVQDSSFPKETVGRPVN